MSDYNYHDYNCPDCNEAKLQSDKNARKINEVIDQVNALIQVNNETVDFIEEKANEVLEELGETKLKEEINSINTSLDNLESEVNELKDANVDIDLSDYATKEYVDDAINDAKLEGGDVQVDLSSYAKKSDLHSHSNKSVLDNITTSIVNEWNNKSNFSGSYNDLTNKPTIPTKTSQLTNDSGFIKSIPSDYVTKDYVDDAINNVDIDLSDYATKDYVDDAINNANLEGGDTQVDSSNLLINLKSFGVREGNNNEIIVNNTTILQSLIEQYPKGQRTFYLPKGTYYFNPIDLTNISESVIIKLKGENNGMSTSWFKGINTTIKTNMQDFIYDRRSSSPGITFYVDDIQFYSFDGYKNIPSGVCFGAEVNKGHDYNFHFYNVLIHGFDYGFKSPGYSCAGSGGKNIYLSTCHYGIYIYSASHLFQADCVELAYNRVGIRFGTGGSPCSISNIHVANGYLGSDKDDYDRFIVIHTKGGIHISNLYQEAYEGNAQPEKTTIIDYEGWAYGTGPVIVENTPIAIPSGKGGLFFKGRTFLGAGTEETEKPMEIYSGNLSHYPDGCAKFINCKIANNVDLSSIFDVPAQSPGYDINNKMYYKDSKIIYKNSIGKINSKWTYTTYNLSPFNHEGNIYETYNNGFFNEPCNGFKFGDLRVLKNIDSISNIKLKGNIIIEDTLSDALDVGIGFLHTYYIDGVVNYKFYPVATLKASQGVSSFPFDFVVERVSGEDVRTQINLCSMYKDNTKKLKETDFNKIRFKFDVELYRDLM